MISGDTSDRTFRVSVRKKTHPCRQHGDAVTGRVFSDNQYALNTNARSCALCSAS